MLRTYTYGLNRISQNTGGVGPLVPAFYGYDGHGSVRFLTDPTGTVTDRYEYDAFGNLVGVAAVTPNSYLYAGEPYDWDLGFYYMRARWYNPGTGRFLSADTYEGCACNPVTLHKYLYAAGDPVNGKDPSGHAIIFGYALTLGRITAIITFVAVVVNYFREDLLAILPHIEKDIEDLLEELNEPVEETTGGP